MDISKLRESNYVIPISIDRAVIEVNGGCNYTCQMCPQTEGREKQFLKKMSLQNFEKMVAESAKYGLRVVNLEGSGEPTLNPNLPEYIKIVRKYGALPYIYSNGYRMKGDFMKKCVDAGLALFRFSIIGYDKDKYKEWMDSEHFEEVRNNALEMRKYIEETGSDCVVASYHLITDNAQIDYEIEQYRKNFIDVVGSKASIWKMHNWSGVYEVKFKRKGDRKTCGRPFAPELTVRAGGNDGHKLSVAPCCQTLGRDSEAVLGNLDDQTLEEVWNGEQYRWLRQMHAEKRFDEVPFCKDCDFLYDDPEVLVWKNDDMVALHKLKGTKFSLDEFRNG